MTRSLIRSATAAAILLASAASVGGCAHAHASATGRPTAAGRLPAVIASGDTPSASATMICQPEAAAEIAAALGAQTSNPPTPRWSDHVYSCRYVYTTGAMVLSVKELPDEAATTAYYTAAQHNLSSHTPVQVLGLDGFAGPDGSLYVRKDFKVLHVDVAALPDHIGQPPYTRADAAFTVAAVIMSCWTGN